MVSISSSLRRSLLLVPSLHRSPRVVRFMTTPAPAPARRKYYYVVDEHGRLFVEDIKPKNIATSIKDVRFLNFFWERIKPTQQVRQALSEASEYKYVSICEGELNLIKPVDTPIVFHDMVHDSKDACDYLIHAGSLRTKLDIDTLVVSMPGSRLYHACSIGPEHPLLKENKLCLGLISSPLAMLLAKDIRVLDDENVVSMNVKGNDIKVPIIDDHPDSPPVT